MSDGWDFIFRDKRRIWIVSLINFQYQWVKIAFIVSRCIWSILEAVLSLPLLVSFVFPECRVSLGTKLVLIIFFICRAKYKELIRKSKWVVSKAHLNFTEYLSLTLHANTWVCYDSFLMIHQTLTNLNKIKKCLIDKSIDYWTHFYQRTWLAVHCELRWVFVQFDNRSLAYIASSWRRTPRKNSQMIQNEKID
jgi:hypothetical protein